MKLALVTTSPALRSAVGDAVRELLPHLRELCELRLFVEPGGGAGELEGVPFAPIGTLDPRAHDRLLLPVGNEPALAHVPRVARALGGTAMLFEWRLYDLACATYPALARGGLKGHLLALREGGLTEARTYARRRELSPDELRLKLTFNRSIVRHADSFLVRDDTLARRILAERNARTAIGEVHRDPDAGGDWSAFAEGMLAHLSEFPGPRTTRAARIAFGALWAPG